MKPNKLYIDQYGNKFWARTRKELSQQIPGKVSLMYVTKKDERTVRTGYVIGQHWLSAIIPDEKPA